MDENLKNSAKKQREKNQRYKRKLQDKQSESVSPITTDSNVSDPQPQRTNRRQRNEVPTPTNNTNTITSGPTTENKDTKPTSEKENVTIDFSNLKRETEEIAKLTKKFATRNISSNWHRYSAPEGPEDDEETEKEAPADFSALIKMPASRGGHLLLKDEQEWSSNSKEQLGGYFALNLKLLSESLACIPVYEQLRLPKEMFSEEELKHFDSLASNARKVYNPSNREDPNELVLKSLIQEVQNIEDNGPEKYKNTSNDSNVLNAAGSHTKEQSSDILTEKTSRNSSENMYCLSKDDKVSNVKDKSSFDTVSEEKRNSIKLLNEFNVKNVTLEASSPENFTPLESISDNKGLGLEITGIGNFSKMADQSQEAKNLKKDSNDTFINSKKEMSQKNVVVTEDSINENSKNRSIENHRKPSEGKPREIKHTNLENTLKFEDDDDDDLDFLLSLKKPAERKATTEKKMDSSSSKDTKRKSGSEVSSSTEQPSELDDWLDSVLQG